MRSLLFTSLLLSASLALTHALPLDETADNTSGIQGKVEELREGFGTDSSKVPKRPRVALPSGPSQQTIVNSLLHQIDIASVQSNLKEFTSFPDRYYTSKNGVKASNWVYEYLTGLENMSLDENTSIKMTVTRFKHSWAQNSVIARLEGDGGDGALVIFGGHLDSINNSIRFAENAGYVAPGADDDGSAVVTYLEVIRILLKNNIQLKRPVEFHFYAAEEVNRIGSREISAKYAEDGVAVVGMMQLDMIGYVEPGSKEAIALVDDYTDKDLSNLIGKYITTYTNLPVGKDHCGYGCSDHASFYDQGYPTVYPFEGNSGTMNPKMHTELDTIKLINFDHVREFIKLAVATAIELGNA